MKSRFVYLIPFLFALVLPGARSLAKEKQRGFLSFDATKLYPYPSKSFSKGKKGWFTNNATAAKIDTLTLCVGQASVRVRTKAGESVRAMFHFYNRDIVGKKVRFSGKYKYRQAKDAKVAFLIVLDTYLNTVVTSDTVHACEGDSEWMGFTVESEMPRTENFYFQIVTMGDMELWVSDCQAEVDGYSLDILENSSAKVDSDTEFAEESGIQIRRVNERTLDNLELLGKVWGFLKYFHPRVTEGNYNWDFELFRVLPQIAEASDKDTRNALLSQWVDKYGEIEELADYTVRDSTKFHRFAPLQWSETRYCSARNCLPNSSASGMPSATRYSTTTSCRYPTKRRRSSLARNPIRHQLERSRLPPPHALPHVERHRLLLPLYAVHR